MLRRVDVEIWVRMDCSVCRGSGEGYSGRNCKRCDGSGKVNNWVTINELRVLLAEEQPAGQRPLATIIAEQSDAQSYLDRIAKL